ncbi:MAG: hypothetical protein MK078_15745 [Crocinitomicaceae bacterium]|nr:hypothetical protein [Crocinitomicaceae bacterium]
MTLVINSIIGLGMFLIVYFYEHIPSSIIGLTTLVLFTLSLSARIALSKYYSFGSSGFSLGSVLMIPLFMWAAAIDLHAIYIITKSLHPEGGRLPQPFNFILVAAIGISLFVVFREGVNAYGGRFYSTTKKRINRANFIFLSYGLICSAALWNDSLTQLSFTWGEGREWSQLFEAFLYYLVFLLPFERYLLMEHFRENKPLYHIVLGFIFGFGIVVWTVVL